MPPRAFQTISTALVNACAESTLRFPMLSSCCYAAQRLGSGLCLCNILKHPFPTDSITRLVFQSFLPRHKECARNSYTSKANAGMALAGADERRVSR